MKVGIIGFGVVGNAISNTLSKVYSIVPFDRYLGLNDVASLVKCDFIFISVPTPFDCLKNKVDQTAVVENLTLLSKRNYKGIVIIKSTLPPGSTKNFLNNFNLKIVFNPEFLRESTTPNEDFENQEIVVIGTDDLELFSSVKIMYDLVLRKGTKYHSVTPTEAEMIKYSQNTMLAGRVALANMIFDACQKLKIDYDNIRDIGFTPFEILGPHMSQVPGPDGKRGFGGKCLPKDISGFNSIIESNLLKEIIVYNESLRDDLDKVLMNFKK